MSAPPSHPTRSWVPWIIAAALALHVAAWTVWFTIAGRHPVADVPIAARR